MHDSRMHLGRVSSQSAATDRETAPKHSLSASERATANSAMRDVSEPAQLCVYVQPAANLRRYATFIMREGDMRGPVASRSLLQKQHFNFMRGNGTSWYNRRQNISQALSPHLSASAIDFIFEC